MGSQNSQEQLRSPAGNDVIIQSKDIINFNNMNSGGPNFDLQQSNFQSPQIKINAFSNTEHLDSMNSSFTLKYKDQQKNQDDNGMLFLFKWSHGGNNVYVTGNFTNWTQHIQMVKQGNIHTLTLKLAKGHYQYKYIVDGDWKYSPEERTIEDGNGNINNFIDTNNIEIVQYQQNAFFNSNAQYNDSYNSDKKFLGSVSENYEHKPFIDQKKSLTSDNISKVVQDSQLRSIQILQQFAEDFNEDLEAPMIPNYYSEIEFLNQNDLKMDQLRAKVQPDEDMEIENSNKDVYSDDYILKIISSSKELQKPIHVQLNHFGTQSQETSNQNYSTIVLTQRFKGKYTTFKYFKPNLTMAN